MALVSTAARGSGTGSGGTETLISTTVLGSAASFDVSGIVGTYNDLRLVLLCRSSVGASVDTLRLNINADVTVGHYNRATMIESGGAMSGQQANTETALIMGAIPGSTSDASFFGGVQVWLPGYSSSTRHKIILATPVVGFTTTGNSNEQLTIGWWNSTAVITRIQFSSGTGTTFVTGSELRIYGIT